MVLPTIYENLPTVYAKLLKNIPTYAIINLSSIKKAKHSYKIFFIDNK
jgi:hypothetical protein